MEITTRELRKLYELRQEIWRINEQMGVLRKQRDDLQASAKGQEDNLLSLLDRGTRVRSNVFACVVKSHLTQAPINWQKEYHANHPKEYAAIKEERGKVESREVVIAEKVAPNLDELLGVSA